MTDFGVVKKTSRGGAIQFGNKFQCFGSLSEARKHAIQKKQCYRPGVMPDEESKEERQTNSSNYNQRSQNKTTILQSRLNSDESLLEEKRRLALEMSSDELKIELLQILEIADMISQNVFKSSLKRLDINECIQSYCQHKLVIQQKTLTETNHVEEEYNIWKRKFHDLLKNESEYIAQKGRSKFEEEKCQISQKLMRASLRKNCSAHVSLQNIERKVENLRQCENKLKADIWSKFLSRMDNYFEAAKNVGYVVQYGRDWEIVKAFFQEPQKKSTVHGTSFNVHEHTATNNGGVSEKNQMSLKIKTGNMKSTKNKNDHVPKYKYMASTLTSPQTSAAPTKRVYVDSESNAKRCPWYGSVGDYVPEEDNEITVSTLIQSKKTNNQAEASMTIVKTASAKTQRKIITKIDNKNGKIVKMIRIVKKTNEVVKHPSANSQVIKKAGIINSKVTPNRSPLNGLIDNHIQELVLK